MRPLNKTAQLPSHSFLSPLKRGVFLGKHYLTLKQIFSLKVGKINCFIAKTCPFPITNTTVPTRCFHKLDSIMKPILSGKLSTLDENGAQHVTYCFKWLFCYRWRYSVIWNLRGQVIK